MSIVVLPKSALRNKIVACIDNYLSLSEKQHISIGLYIKGKKYVLGLNDNEKNLFYDIGSISKTLTAHLILKIFKEEGLDINRPICDYLHLKSGKYPTVYELLTHTAGYNHFTPIEITLPHLLKHRYAYRNLYENVTGQAVIKALEKRNNAKGGYRYGYSDFSYAVLALVAESIKHKRFYIQLEDFLRNDLMLNNTTVTRQSELPKAIFNKKEIPFWCWEKENPYIASGGMVSNIFDMIQYIQMEIEKDDDYILNAHEICPTSFKKDTSIGTCTGWHTYKNSNRLWHVGGVGTFRSSIMLTRKKGFGVVVLGNTKGVQSANVHYITKILYSEIKSKKIQPSAMIYTPTV